MNLEKNVPVEEITLKEDYQKLPILRLLIPSPEELENPNWKNKQARPVKKNIKDKLRSLFSKKNKSQE